VDYLKFDSNENKYIKVGSGILDCIQWNIWKFLTRESGVPSTLEFRPTEKNPKEYALDDCSLTISNCGNAMCKFQFENNGSRDYFLSAVQAYFDERISTSTTNIIWNNLTLLKESQQTLVKALSNRGRLFDESVVDDLAIDACPGWINQSTTYDEQEPSRKRAKVTAIQNCNMNSTETTSFQTAVQNTIPIVGLTPIATSTPKISNLGLNESSVLVTPRTTAILVEVPFCCNKRASKNRSKDGGLYQCNICKKTYDVINNTVPGSSPE